MTNKYSTTINAIRSALKNWIKKKNTLDFIAIQVKLLYCFTVLHRSINIWQNLYCFRGSAEEDDTAAAAATPDGHQAKDCGLFELLVTAPDGTTITTGDSRYTKQDDFRLITIDASGFKVRIFWRTDSVAWRLGATDLLLNMPTEILMIPNFVNLDSLPSCSNTWNYMY